jgi:hypothetical protein
MQVLKVLNAHESGALDYSWKKATSCLFCFNNFYLSSIAAVNQSFRYFIQLLLRNNDDCDSVIFNNSHETKTSLVACIVDTLSTASPYPFSSSKHYEEKARFKPDEMVYLLHNFMKNEKKALNELKYSHATKFDQSIIDTQDETVTSFVETPTILFHFSRSNIDSMVNNLVNDNKSLSKRFGDRPQNWFLSPVDVAMIDKFPNSVISATRKKALKFDIGIHTASVKEGFQYLRLVEELFQNRKLKFLFATGSIAVGINLPCSNVVFLGTSTFLSNMLFNQCAGRAGRRGYGSGIGNVYFVGFSLLNMVRKLCLPIDNLLPQQPISSAFVLRTTAFTTTCDESNKYWVHDVALLSMVNPLFERLLQNNKETRSNFQSALINSCLFSWSFLNERGFLFLFLFLISLNFYYFYLISIQFKLTKKKKKKKKGNKNN